MAKRRALLSVSDKTGLVDLARGLSDEGFELISTGGTATDVTDDVHPEVAARAIAAARMVGLDIAGVDVVCDSVLKPLEDQGGGIVEVTMRDGKKVNHFTKYPPGTKESPLNTEGVNAKVRDLMTPVLGAQKAEARAAELERAIHSAGTRVVELEQERDAARAEVERLTEAYARLADAAGAWWSPGWRFLRV